MHRCTYCPRPSVHQERVGQVLFCSCDDPRCEERYDDAVADAETEERNHYLSTTQDMGD